MRCTTHGEEMKLFGGTVLECLSCLNKNTDDFDTHNLIIRAAMGLMREPIIARRTMQEAA